MTNTENTLDLNEWTMVRYRNASRFVGVGARRGGGKQEDPLPELLTKWIDETLFKSEHVTHEIFSSISVPDSWADYLKVSVIEKVGDELRAQVEAEKARGYEWVYYGGYEEDLEVSSVDHVIEYPTYYQETSDRDWNDTVYRDDWEDNDKRIRYREMSVAEQILYGLTPTMKSLWTDAEMVFVCPHHKTKWSESNFHAQFLGVDPDFEFPATNIQRPTENKATRDAKASLQNHYTGLNTDLLKFVEQSSDDYQNNTAMAVDFHCWGRVLGEEDWTPTAYARNWREAQEGIHLIEVPRKITRIHVCPHIEMTKGN